MYAYLVYITVKTALESIFSKKELSIMGNKRAYKRQQSSKQYNKDIFVTLDKHRKPDKAYLSCFLVTLPQFWHKRPETNIKLVS